MSPRPPSLAVLMRQLRDGADARGAAGPVALAHGATLTMRSREALDDAGVALIRRQLIIARRDAPVGLVETTTFLGHGRIPADAVGVCYPPREGVWRVAYTWDVRLVPFDVIPLPLGGMDAHDLPGPGDHDVVR